MRLLLVKLSSLGDVIHNLPVASDLARHLPGVQIDWAVEAPYAELVELHPAIHRVYPVGLRNLKKQLLSPRAWRIFLQQRHTLGRQSYDGILDTQGLLKSAWIARWADGPVSGYDRQSAREPLAARFYQHRFAVSRDQHAVARNRALAAASFGYALTGAADYGLASSRPALSHDLPAVVFLHATSRTSKMWPDSCWGDLGRRVIACGFGVTLPWGNAAERLTSERLARAIPGALVPPAMPLHEAAHLLAGAAAVVGVDTGLAHLAVALGRPTIGLYITTEPLLTGLHGGADAHNLGGGSEAAPYVPTVERVWSQLQPYLGQPRGLSMRRLIYSGLLLVVLPFIVLRLLWRGARQPGYLQNVSERFGLGAPTLLNGSLWLHAVSVGEMRAAEPLVRRLRAAFPEQAIYLTCMTPTGRETAYELFGKLAGVWVAYLPYDFALLHRRVVDRIRPSVLIVMETEIWPNLLAACASRHVPVWLANARLSPRSFTGYQRLAPVRKLIADALSSLCGTAAQTPGDAERLRLLGAANIVVTGNVKFDARPDPVMVALGLDWRRKLEPKRGVLLAASTREGEEILLLKAFQQQFAQQDGNDVLLVLVPRHPQRFNEVAKLVEQSGLRLQRRSSSEAISGQTAVWLGDSMGEMTAYVAMCDLAFVGGSLLPLGGQNLIEVCAQGKPVLMGPSVFNFAEAAQLAGEAGALLQAGDGGGVMKLAALLLSDEARRAAMSLAACKFADTHAGASDRLFALVTSNLPGRK